MAISYDNTAGVVGSGTGNLSWTHTGASSGVKGVVVQIVQNAQTNDQITSVSYGSLTLTRVAGATVFHTAGAEDGAVYTYVGTSSIPQGAQTVNVVVTATGANKDAHSYTFLASGDTRVIASNTADTANTGGTTASVSLVGSAGIGALSVGLLHSSVNSVSGMAASTGFTDVEEVDLGNQCASFTRINTTTVGTIVHAWTVTANTEAGIGAVALVDTAQTKDPTTEVATLTDTRTRDIGKTWSETTSLLDTVLKAAAVVCLEVLTLTDPAVTTVHAKNYSQELTETAVLVDTVLRDPARALTEATPLLDTIQKGASRTFTETASLTDECTTPIEAVAIAAVYTDGRAVLPQVNVETYVNWAYGDGKAGPLPATKAVGGGQSKTLTDSATLTDTFERTAAYQRTLTESATLGDALSKGTARDLAEVATLTDSITNVHGATLTLTESALLSDSHLEDISRTLNETASLSDVIEHQAALNRTEALGLSDTLTKGGGKVLTESVTPADTLRYGPNSWQLPINLLSIGLGSVVSGSVLDLWHSDANVLLLAEVTGGPGFIYDFFFGPFAPYLSSPQIPSGKLTLTINGWYDGNLGHDVHVYQYNFVTTVYDRLTAVEHDLPDETSEKTYQFVLFVDVNHISGGMLSIEIKHDSSGNPTHQLHLNGMFLSRLADPTEVATLTDTLTKGGGKDLVETVGLTDSLTTQAGVSREFVETLTLADVARKDTGRALTEAVALSDVLTKQVELARTYTELVALGDSLTTDHTSAGAYSKTLTETAGLTDTFERQSDRARTLSETASLTDTANFGRFAGPIETATLADDLSIIATLYHIFSETATLNDSIERAVAITLTESASLTDAVTKDTGRGLTEGLNLTDVLSTVSALQTTLTESATLSDTVSKATGRALTEGLGLADALTKGPGKVLTEGVSLADQRLRNTGRTLSEGLSLTDSLTLTQTQKNLAELVTLSDSLTKDHTHLGSYTKELTETALLSDSFERTVNFQRTLTEGLSLLDSQLDDVGLPIGEQLGLTDSPTKATGRSLAEQLSLGDSLTTQYTPGAGNNYTQDLTETALLTDTLSRVLTATRTLTEQLGLQDSLEKGTGRALTEGVSLADGLAKGRSVTLTETAVLSDSLTKVVTAARTLTEQITLFDPTLLVGFAGSANPTELVTLLDTLGPRAISRTLTETAGLTGSVNVPLKLKEGLSLGDSLTTVLQHNRVGTQKITLLDSLTVIYGPAGPYHSELVTLSDSLGPREISRTLVEGLTVRAAGLAPDIYQIEASLVFAG